MDLIGKIVIHNKYGKGMSVRQNEKNGNLIIYVYFEIGDKKEIPFQFPQAFVCKEKWLSTCDEQLLLYLQNFQSREKELNPIKENRSKSVETGLIWMDANAQNSKINFNKAIIYQFNDRKAKYVRIPKEIKYVGRSCFSRMKALEEIVLENVKEIGPEAFLGCKNLKRVILPNCLLRIGGRAFEYCTSLRNIFIPNYCSYIGESAFNFNYALKEINCAVKQMPIFWDRRWNKNKKCNVFFGIELIDNNQNNKAMVEKRNSPSGEQREKYICDKTNILYVYKGNIRCYKNHHNLISATAIVRTKNDKEISLNVEYCKDCNKLLLNYNLFEEYRERYEILIGNFRVVINDNFDGQYILSKESPLHLSNYNVGQKDNLKESERHYILARIIYDGIMKKHQVIDYLQFFINLHGGKSRNGLALSKWHTDLKFVQQYDINKQPKFAVKEIKRYK